MFNERLQRFLDKVIFDTERESNSKLLDMLDRKLEDGSIDSAMLFDALAHPVCRRAVENFLDTEEPFQFLPPAEVDGDLEATDTAEADDPTVAAARERYYQLVVAFLKEYVNLSSEEQVKQFSQPPPLDSMVDCRLILDWHERKGLEPCEVADCLTNQETYLRTKQNFKTEGTDNLPPLPRE